MLIKIKKKYLLIPTSSNEKLSTLLFKINGEIVYSLNLKLTSKKPTFISYIDVKRYIGKEIFLENNNNINFKIKQSNKLLTKKEQYRPFIHFTCKRGWINDPNGLIYHKGLYHMFYQYNPCDIEWENMHWGHAVSKDLIHWKERPIALFIDQLGTIFSGSALADKKHIFSNKDAVLLYYTAAGKPFTQCMAYTTNNFKTIAKYKNNPIINHIVDENRDPKVVWCEKLNSYIMSLYLHKDLFAIFKSEDLINFTEIQRLEIKGEDECPNLFKIKADDGSEKWVFIGAHDVYLVGDFVSNKFVPLQKEKQLHTGSSSYASQFYTDLDDDRIIRIAWGRWNKLRAKTFSQQMSIPYEFMLKKINNEYYLCSAPCKELANIIKSKIELNDINIEKRYFYSLNKNAYSFTLKGKYDAQNILTLKIFNQIVTIDFINNKIKCGNYINHLSLLKDELNLNIIVDKTSIEIASDEGKILFMVTDIIIDYRHKKFIISSLKPYLLSNINIISYKQIFK